MTVGPSTRGAVGSPMPGNSPDSWFVLRNLVAKDFKVRYRNMSLGILWSLVNPLVMMGVLTFVFTVVWDNPRPNFWLFVLLGIVPYNFFALAWATGTTSIIDNAPLVKKVPFRRELLPISVVLANSLHFLIQFGLLLIAVGFVIGPSWSWLWLPLVLLLQLAFVTGLSLATSALDVYVRDMRYIVESVNLILFWLVPIFYGFDQISPELAPVYQYNPVAAVVLITRTILMRGAEPDLSTLVKLAGVTAVAFVVGLVLFRRLRRDFSDYL